MNVSWFFAEIKRNTILEHIPKIYELVNGNLFFVFERE